MKLLGKKVILFDQKKHDASIVIQRFWRLCRYHPSYKMCETVQINNQKEIEQELTTRSAQESESVPVAPAVTQPADLSSATATEPPVNTIDLGEIKTLKELEYEAIVAGLARTKWNLTTTARQLGISRMTLYRKLDQHDLRKKD